jgi:hypothetical protein
MDGKGGGSDTKRVRVILCGQYFTQTQHLQYLNSVGNEENVYADVRSQNHLIAQSPVSLPMARRCWDEG